MLEVYVFAGQALYSHQHRLFPHGHCQSHGRVPCPHREVSPPSVRRPLGSDHGSQHVHHRGDQAEAGPGQPNLPLCYAGMSHSNMQALVQTCW